MNLQAHKVRIFHRVFRMRAELLHSLQETVFEGEVTSTVTLHCGCSVHTGEHGWPWLVSVLRRFPLHNPTQVNQQLNQQLHRVAVVLLCLLCFAIHKQNRLQQRLQQTFQKLQKSFYQLILFFLRIFSRVEIPWIAFDFPSMGIHEKDMEVDGNRFFIDGNPWE